MSTAEQELHQRLFDLTSVHLIEQGRPAYTQSKDDPDNKTCAYRAKNGCVCAVGALIEDRYYTDELENCTISSYTVQQAVSDSLGIEDLDRSSIDLLRDIQQAHDSTVVKNEKRFRNSNNHHWLKKDLRQYWKSCLRDIAAENDLNTDALDAACVKHGVN